MDLVNRILEQGKQDVDNILKVAKEEAKEEKDFLIKEAKDDCSTRYKAIKKEVDSEIKTKERMLFFETKQAELLAKQTVLENIFGEVLNKINDLENEELLNYVINQIKKETIAGDEVLYVNKNDYSKYTKALSTSKSKEALIDADVLNNALKTKIKISNNPVDIKGGFVLEGKFFDMNFATEEIIESLKKKHERSIAKELFE